MRFRQGVGLVALAVALIVVAVVAGLRPHTAPGSAQAPPVAQPPAIGDCVLDAVTDPGAQVPHNSPALGDAAPEYPVQRVQACAGTRFGEIVSLIASPHPLKNAGDDVNGHYVDDPNRDSCFAAAWPYVGMSLQPIQRFWYSYLQVTVAVAGPSLRQEAAGQHWAACIVSKGPVDPTPSAATNHTPQAAAYNISIRDALHTGVLRDELGNCRTAIDWNGGLGSGACRQPHALDLFGYGHTYEHAVSRAELQLTCQQLIRQLTAMPDPTAAGALSIQVGAEDANGGATITTPQIPARAQLDCAVATTGSRKLRGSLLALGGKPVTWA